MGVEVTRVEGEGVVCDGMVVSEGEGGVSPRAPRAPLTGQE